MKARICFIINNISQGGAERQLVELVTNLDNQTYDKTVCIYAFKGQIFFPIRGAKVITNRLQSRFKPFRVFEALIFLSRFLATQRYDVIQTTLFINSFLVRIAAGWRKQNRVIASIRTSSYKWWHYFCEAVLIRNSWLVVNNKRAMGVLYKKLARKYSRRIFYIPNGLDTEHFSFEGSHSLLSDHVVLGSVGRFSKEKNHIVLLEAFNALQSDLEVILYLIGSNSDQSRKIEHYVKANGLTDKILMINETTDIRSFYKEIEIFVLPSLYEGCPNVLLEAMASGCICIVSEGANSEGIIDHKSNGFVFDTCSVDSLERVIRNTTQILGSEVDERIRRNARHKVQQFYSSPIMVARYQRVYQMIQGIV